MKRLFIVGYCLLLIGCNSQPPHDKTNSIHPHIIGVVKEQGQAVVNAQISLSSSNCDTVTVITDANGQFNLEQYCPIATPSIAVMGAVADMSTPFDITISINGKAFVWSVIDPYDIKVEFDLSEQMACQTSIQESHCSHLLLQDNNSNVIP